MTDPEPLPPAACSALVSCLAWVLLAVTAPVSIGALVHSVLTFTLIPLDELLDSDAGRIELPSLRLYSQFSASPSWSWHLGFFLVSAFAFAAALGLKRRRNWARRLVVVLLCCGTFWILVGSFFPHLNPLQPGFHNYAPPPAGGALQALRLAGAHLPALCLAALLAWLARHLCSRPIRAEFQPPAKCIQRPT